MKNSSLVMVGISMIGCLLLGYGAGVAVQPASEEDPPATLTVLLTFNESSPSKFCPNEPSPTGWKVTKSVQTEEEYNAMRDGILSILQSTPQQ